MVRNLEGQGAEGEINAAALGLEAARDRDAAILTYCRAEIRSQLVDDGLRKIRKRGTGIENDGHAGVRVRLGSAARLANANRGHLDPVSPGASLVAFGLRWQVLELVERTRKLPSIEAAKNHHTAVAGVLARQGHTESPRVCDTLGSQLIDEILVLGVEAVAVTHAGDSKREILASLPEAKNNVFHGAIICGNCVSVLVYLSSWQPYPRQGDLLLPDTAISSDTYATSTSPLP